MASSTDAPKVFISYSWKPLVNKQKSIALAERLENEGVKVLIDEWDLAEGQDKYQFMEQMVNNPEVKKVLIICNKDYADKANSKSGGVGIESLIISDEVYSKVDQTKFIPIIFERNSDGNEFVPTFIKSRIYIDLSDDEIFEEEYEKLMRNIFDKPASKRPPRGIPPSYILQDDSTFLRTLHKVQTIRGALVNEKKNAQVFIDDYYSTFIEALVDFEINTESLKEGLNIDDIVISKIDEIKILRNDFVAFLEIILTYSDVINVDKLISFLEKLVEFIIKRDFTDYPEGSRGRYMSDQYKFFFYELFLYLTAVMIDKEKFKELGEILNSQFVIFNQRVLKTESYDFFLFNQDVESLNNLRNERLQMRRLNLTADIIKQRADLSKYNFEKLRECDVLLYFISLIQNESEVQLKWKGWIPHSTAYNIFNLPLLERLISKRHFEKLKYLFAVTTVEELKLKVERINQIGADKIERVDYNFPNINRAFNVKTIGTIS